MKKNVFCFIFSVLAAGEDVASQECKKSKVKSSLRGIKCPKHTDDAVSTSFKNRNLPTISSEKRNGTLSKRTHGGFIIKKDSISDQKNEAMPYGFFETGTHVQYAGEHEKSSLDSEKYVDEMLMPITNASKPKSHFSSEVVFEKPARETKHDDFLTQYPILSTQKSTNEKQDQSNEQIILFISKNDTEKNFGNVQTSNSNDFLKSFMSEDRSEIIVLSDSDDNSNNFDETIELKSTTEREKRTSENFKKILSNPNTESMKNNRILPSDNGNTITDSTKLVGINKEYIEEVDVQNVFCSESESYCIINYDEIIKFINEGISDETVQTEEKILTVPHEILVSDEASIIKVDEKIDENTGENRIEKIEKNTNGIENSNTFGNVKNHDLTSPTPAVIGYETINSHDLSVVPNSLDCNAASGADLTIKLLANNVVHSSAYDEEIILSDLNEKTQIKDTSSIINLLNRGIHVRKDDKFYPVTMCAFQKSIEYYNMKSTQHIVPNSSNNNLEKNDKINNCSINSEPLNSA
ncbi:hypothetical protein EDEG_02691 [Edhazardia aedis USNM 41457]|uniref:Uncharacterized protein n=1 Tax=Edhazardia aedis (strain USNM 41457) TaxID=1003232 RepID=J9D540_EDHAE|nr:hypothetical protein EDEG_02691 [Edhazardia aedis USNM 41457]|eukprot:EJW02926.1 hypothetical protein EDEG_02691 [Edhazardia aedis USNM 41457]